MKQCDTNHGASDSWWSCVIGGHVRWRSVSTTSVQLEHLRSYCSSASHRCSLHYSRSIAVCQSQSLSAVMLVAAVCVCVCVCVCVLSTEHHALLCNIVCRACLLNLTESCITEMNF